MTQNSTTNPFDVFIYYLLKEHLPTDAIEEIVSKVSSVIPGTVVFNNALIGQYAQQLRERLENLDGAVKVEVEDELPKQEVDNLLEQLKASESLERKCVEEAQYEDLSIDIDLEELQKHIKDEKPMEYEVVNVGFSLSEDWEISNSLNSDLKQISQQIKDFKPDNITYIGYQHNDDFKNKS